MAIHKILGTDAKNFGQEDKWRMLSPFLRKHGREALSYATIQAGMEYYIDDELGYVAFTTATHPVFARKPKRIVLSDPVCAREDLSKLMDRFLGDGTDATFVVISEFCAEELRLRGYKINCLGPEPELPVQTYNTKGNWKNLDMIKRARNEAKREGIAIREERLEDIDPAKLEEISAKWMGSKILNDREIWIYARKPFWGTETDVRKFVAYDSDDQIVGFVFYDPIYRDDMVVGYSANTSRCDEKRFGRLATAIHMVAVDIFRAEGIEVLNLCLAPFVRLHLGKYNDDRIATQFFKLSEKYGNEIYNFKGLAFHKSKYRVPEKPLYLASRNWSSSNDIYLAYLSSNITESYFSTMGMLLKGIAKGILHRDKKPRTQPS